MLKYKLGRGPVFKFRLAGGRCLPPVSYATDQVHFKHEQPQVLLDRVTRRNRYDSANAGRSQRALSILTQ